MASLKEKQLAFHKKQEKLEAKKVVKKKSFREEIADSAYDNKRKYNLKTSLTEQVFSIFNYLEAHPDRSFQEKELQDAFKKIPFTDQLKDTLAAHENIHVEKIFDTTYRFKPKFAIKDIDEMRDFITRQPLGVRKKEIIKSYANVEQDIQELSENREIIVIDLKASKRSKVKDQTLFPNKKHLEMSLQPELKKKICAAWRRSTPPVNYTNEMKQLGIP